MKSVTFFVALAFALLVISSRSHATDCEVKVQTLETRMDKYSDYVDKMSGISEQVITAKKMKDTDRLRGLKSDLVDEAYKVIGISTEILNVLDLIDADPDNCSGGDDALFKIRYSMTTSIEESKAIIAHMENY